MAETTDAARELAALIDRMRAFDASGGQPGHTAPNWDVMSRGLGLAAGSPDFIEALSAVRGRIERLREFASGLSDPTVGRDVTQHVLEAIDRFAGVLNPQFMNTEWNHTIKHYLTAGDATTLRMYSPIVVRYRPLRSLTDAERSDALNQISEALADLNEADDLDHWERQALSHGYRRLQLVLRYFEFFGHEGISQELVSVASATKAVEAKLQPTSRTLKRAWAALATAARIVEVVAAPSVAHQAGLDYYQTAQQLIAMAPAPKLLTGPSGPEAPSAPEECIAAEPNADNPTP
ncbi:MAG TPA: hypothetical protein VGL58_08445 [Caulobacteraceae bacterium]|jgi:hypothetical protein